ncbi:MAG: AMP-binding protein, partial [Deltaproteobacteria bacterium]|nr:AMP-binding protein [Deltaproteobacteria bacterium]
FAGTLAMALARVFPEAGAPFVFGRLWQGRPGPESRGAVGSFARTALVAVPAPPAHDAPAGEAEEWSARLQESFRDSDRYRACPAEDLADEFPGVPDVRVSHEFLPPELLSWPGVQGTFIPLPPSGGSSPVNLHLAEDRGSVHLFLKLSEAISPTTSKALLDAVLTSWERLASIPARLAAPDGEDDGDYFVQGAAPGAAGLAGEGAVPDAGAPVAPGASADADAAEAPEGAERVAFADGASAAPALEAAGAPAETGVEAVAEAAAGAAGLEALPSEPGGPEAPGPAVSVAFASEITGRGEEAPSGPEGEVFGMEFPPEDDLVLPPEKSRFASFPHGLPPARRQEILDFCGTDLQMAFPCAPGQEDWFLPGRLPAPPPSSRVEARRAVVRGVLAPAAVYRRARELCRRLDVMRLAVLPGDPPVNVLRRRAPAVREVLRFADLSGLALVQRERRISEMTAQDAEALSDASRGGGFRAALVKTGPDSSELVLSTSRLAFDPASAQRLLECLVSASDGPLPAFPSLAGALGSLPGPDGLERGLKSWKAALAGVDASTRIPRRPGFTELKDGGGILSVTMRLRPETNTRLEEAAAREGVPKALFLAGVWAVVLGRLSQNDAAVFGLELPGDQGAARATEGREAPLGPLALQMPIAASLPWGGTFSDLLKELRNAAVRAAATDFISRGGLAPLTPLGTDVFSHGFSYLPPFRAEGVEVERVKESGSPGCCSLSLNVRDHLRMPELHFAYRTALYEPWQVEVLALAFQSAMDDAAASPGAAIGSLRLSDPDQDLSLVRQNNARPVRYSGATVMDLFGRAAKENPEAAAIVGGDLTQSYRDLDNESEKLAAQLKVAGYGPGSRVATVFGRGDAAYPAVLLGVLKSGACAYPLSADMPADLLKSLLSESAPDLVVCGQRLPQNLASAMDVLGDAPVADPQGYYLKGGSSGVMGFSKLSVHFVKRERDRVAIDPDAPAYVVYATGRLLGKSGEAAAPDARAADAAQGDGLHADGLHADGLHADGLHADGLHADGLHADGLH